MKAEDFGAFVVVRIIYFLIGAIGTWITLLYPSRWRARYRFEEFPVPQFLEPLFSSGDSAPIFLIVGIIVSPVIGIISMLIGPTIYKSIQQSDVWVSTKNIGD